MLTSLASTKNGLKQIRQKAEERLTFVNLAAYSGGKERLSVQEKNAFHSPYIRYLALQEAVRKHYQVMTPTEIANKVASMDWDAPLLPRRVFFQSSSKGDREISKSVSLEDSAKAYLVKMILEAEWGSYLDPHSYGVSGKGVVEAIGAVAEYVHEHPMWYYRTDIKACFASIDQTCMTQDLQKKLTRYMWTKLQPHLMATIEDGKESWCPESGITTGSPLSALALDIFLNNLSREITEGFGEEDVRVFRYVDDILILSPNIDVLNTCVGNLSTWLQGVGLETNLDKTETGTTLAVVVKCNKDLNPIDSNYVWAPWHVGMTYLGTRISQYQNPEGTGYDTWIELDIPEGTTSSKSWEERMAYHKNVKQYVNGIRTKVGDKAFMGSWLDHEYQLPLIPKEPESFERRNIGTVTIGEYLE